ncbi:MAG: hypothetical protein HOQ34_09465 [Gemmatimonadaceae bacterium]|nr:hypothetical protein [Gemmatimonadaceae bacterium]
MTGERTLSVVYAIPLDYELYVEADVLGYQRDVVVGGQAARLEFPRPLPPDAKSLALTPPTSAARWMAHHLGETGLGIGWGIKPERVTYAEIGAILLAFPLIFEGKDLRLENVQAGGTMVQELLEGVTEWFDSLIRWVWVASAQALDPMNPDPKVLHRRSHDVLVALRSEEVDSLPSTPSPSLSVRLDIDSPTSERLLNRDLLDRMVAKAGTDLPPIMWELLASARMAGRRGDARRALIDAGTAAEAALSILLGLQPGHQLTLGALVVEATKKGVVIPPDSKTALVQPRNDAIHRGRWPTSAVDRALEIAEEFVSQADNTFVPSTSLRSVNRPQRSDIRFILAPETK